jgi:hypothetical protein
MKITYEYTIEEAEDALRELLRTQHTNDFNIVVTIQRPYVGLMSDMKVNKIELIKFARRLAEDMYKGLVPIRFADAPFGVPVGKGRADGITLAGAKQYVEQYFNL